MAQQGRQSTAARGRGRPSERRIRSRSQRDRLKRRRVLIAGLVAILIILAIPLYGYTSTFVLPPRQWVVQVNDTSYNMGYLLKLLRMFQRWAGQQGFEFTITDILKGEEAGVKSVTAFVRGTNAYGLLKGEMGVHRLVRISPFDSNKRRHTSFASMDVLA